MLKLKTIFKSLILGVTLAFSVVVGHAIYVKYLQPPEMIVEMALESGERYIQLSSDSFIMGDTGYTKIYGRISEADAHALWGKCISFTHFKVKRVVIYINSPGGDVTSAFSIIDGSITYLKNHGIVVEAHASGRICSAAVAILASCSYRIAGENTVFVVHNPSMRSSNPSDLIGLAIFTRRYVGVLEKHTNLSAETWLNKMAIETWFESEDALKYGLIDEILEDNLSGLIEDIAKDLSDLTEDIGLPDQEKEM